MSDPNFGPLAGIALYAIVRAFTSNSRARAGERSVTTPIVTPPPRRRIVPPPPAVNATGDSPATLRRRWPLPAEGPLVVPVEKWNSSEELIAWRFWALGRHPGDGEVRLTSIAAHWAWDGPVFQADRTPGESPFSYAGVHALRQPCTDAGILLTPICWITGWVALSGRVVEHEHGYRAERAVIRSLRLGFSTHLAVSDHARIATIVYELERRYQTSVDPGLTELAQARSILAASPGAGGRGVPVIPGFYRFA
jgi:hypothetical protein